MRTMTRTATHIDVNDRISYLLIGGGVIALLAAVLAAITV